MPTLLEAILATVVEEFNKVELFMNRGKPAAEWLGIRLYGPERVADETVF